MKAAHIYASRLGWRVVPLHDMSAGVCSCHEGARCIKSAGKHPRISDWVNAASSDPDVIEAWWRKYPTANFGIATGVGSGFFALDEDPVHGGDVTLAALIAEHGPLPITTQARTGSGGYHYLFTSDVPVGTNASKIGPGLDIRGEGGQIVVAPSRSGKGAYSWVHAPWDVPPAPAPAWLLERLGRVPSAVTTAPVTDRGYFPPASPEILDQVRVALEAHGPAITDHGGGLHTVHAAAILTHDFALTDDEAWPLFVEWNQTCQPPWELDGGTATEPDLRIMLGRGLKYGKLAYGCRRTLDVRASAKRATEAWVAAGAKEDELVSLLQPIRKLIRERADPVERDLIQQDLMTATGKGALALGLPRGYVRASPAVRKVTGDAVDFDTSANGNPLDNLNNAVIVLERQKRSVWFDEFFQQIRTSDGEWTDGDNLALALEMQRVIGLKKMQTKTVHEAVTAYARRRARDSVRDSLEALVWDGEQRITGFLTRAFSTADNEYTRAASTNFWRSMVVRVFRPGEKVDNMLVLEGVQGLKKSSALQAIAGPELFAESASDPKDKDFFIALAGKMIVEVAELDSFSRASVTAVKRVLTCQVDRYRPPYGRSAENFPRRGIFVGTTNRSDWNTDDTGARRFWPVWCNSVDLGYIRENRLQLFAEAVADVKAGESWWEMPAEAAAAEQDARRQVDPWEELLDEYLTGDGANVDATIVGLLEHPLGVSRDRMSKTEQMRVARILRSLGFSKVDGWIEGVKRKFWKRDATAS